MKHQIASNEQVALTRAFIKRFCVGKYAHLYNNKRKTFRLLKYWLLDKSAARDVQWFLKANNIPGEMNSPHRDPRRKSLYLYTDLSA